MNMNTLNLILFILNISNVLILWNIRNMLRKTP